MFRFTVLVLYFSLVDCGFISVNRDHIVSEVPEGERMLFQKDVSGTEDGQDYHIQVGRDLTTGTKDLVMPLLMGLIMKALTLLPVILTTLAVIAGFSLASSKLALLLGGGLMLYQYLSELKLLLPVAKQMSHFPETAGLPFHHEVPDYTRDRAIDLPAHSRDPGHQ